MARRSAAGSGTIGAPATVADLFAGAIVPGLALVALYFLYLVGTALLYGAYGVLSQRHVDYYRERAAGGAALLER